jgi:hypothetical protein
MKGVDIKLISGYEDLTEIELEELQKNGVCLDDWDYMLFVPVDLLIEEVLDNEVVYCTKKYELDR